MVKRRSSGSRRVKRSTRVKRRKGSRIKRNSRTKRNPRRRIKRTKRIRRRNKIQDGGPKQLTAADEPAAVRAETDALRSELGVQSSPAQPVLEELNEKWDPMNAAATYVDMIFDALKGNPKLHLKFESILLCGGMWEPGDSGFNNDYRIDMAGRLLQLSELFEEYAGNVRMEWNPISGPDGENKNSYFESFVYDQNRGLGEPEKVADNSGNGSFCGAHAQHDFLHIVGGGFVECDTAIYRSGNKGSGVEQIGRASCRERV